MIFDDAASHLGDDAFPGDAPLELSGTHLGLLLVWCFRRGHAGALHLDGHPEAVDAVIAGEQSGTRFVFDHCGGALRDVDVAADVHAFLASYCPDALWADYVALVGEPYTRPESDVDVDAFCATVDARYQAHAHPAGRGGDDASLARFRQSDEARRARGDPDAPPVVPWKQTWWGLIFIAAGILISMARNCE